jgi:hypothetical protein
MCVSATVLYGEEREEKLQNWKAMAAVIVALGQIRPLAPYLSGLRPVDELRGTATGRQ